MTAPSPILTLAELEAFDLFAPVGGMRRRFCCPLCGGPKRRDAAHRSLSVHTESGRWRCFRCGNKGKLREFWLPPRQAQSLALRSSFTLKARAVSVPGPASQEPESSAWWNCWNTAGPLVGSKGAAYVEGRGIPASVAVGAGVRYTNDFFGREAVLFPVVDRLEAVVAVAGRYCDTGSPKSRSFGPKGLGVFTTPGALQSALIAITEAPIDALTLASCGIPAIALCGTSAPSWLPVLTAFRSIALALDADDAGDSAGDALAQTLTSLGARVSRWRPVTSKDWNEALQAAGSLPCWYCASGPPGLYRPTAIRDETGRLNCGAHLGSPEDRLTEPTVNLEVNDGSQPLLSVAFADAAAPARPYHEAPFKTARKR